MERVTGIGPVSRPWQGRIIAIIRYPLGYFFDLDWSGVRESDSRLMLGKHAYYHCTNPAGLCFWRFRIYFSENSLLEGQGGCQEVDIKNKNPYKM